MGYALGAVKPWVGAAANEIGARYGVTTVYGVGSRSNVSDHPRGLALDFMVYNDRLKGEQIAAYCVANASRLSVKYVIWWQKIWLASNPGKGWTQMEDRGSFTANHKDHPHVSFLDTPSDGGGAAIDTPTFAGQRVSGSVTTGFTESSGGGANLLGMLFDPTIWLRVGMVILGVILVFMAIIKFGKEQAKWTQ